MDKEFVKIAEKIIDERGKSLLFNNKLTKALFMDYGRGEFKNEINLLVKTIELKYTKRIVDSDDLNITKMILTRQLTEEQFINDKVAGSIVLLLIGLLRDKNYLNEIDEELINKSTGINIDKKIDKNVVAKNTRSVIRDYQSNYRPQIGIWTCTKCDQDNNDTMMVCKGCGADRPSNRTSNRSIFIPINKVPMNNSSIKISRIICFNCNREFNVDIDESNFKETRCKYCNKKITLKNVIFK
jgi:DNA-directed RNA polymerase subunit RPC12/RpoP